jgi:hypothetical protein
MVQPDRPQPIWRKHTLAPVHPHPHARTSMHQPTRALTYTHTHMYYLLFFHGSNGFANDPHCYVIRTLPRLLANLVDKKLRVFLKKLLIYRYIHGGGQTISSRRQQFHTKVNINCIPRSSLLLSYHRPPLLYSKSNSTLSTFRCS